MPTFAEESNNYGFSLLLKPLLSEFALIHSFLKDLKGFQFSFNSKNKSLSHHSETYRKSNFWQRRLVEASHKTDFTQWVRKWKRGKLILIEARRQETGEYKQVLFILKPWGEKNHIIHLSVKSHSLQSPQVCEPR